MQTPFSLTVKEKSERGEGGYDWKDGGRVKWGQSKGRLREREREREREDQSGDFYADLVNMYQVAVTHVYWTP